MMYSNPEFGVHRWRSGSGCGACALVGETRQALDRQRDNGEVILDSACALEKTMKYFVISCRRSLARTPEKTRNQLTGTI